MITAENAAQSEALAAKDAEIAAEVERAMLAEHQTRVDLRTRAEAAESRANVLEDELRQRYRVDLHGNPVVCTFMGRTYTEGEKEIAALHAELATVKAERDEAVALLKQCRPYVSHLAPDDLQAALAAMEGK